MDFASRHAVAEAAPAPPPSAGAVAEEPEYLARCLIVKHSWRGRYRRILCIASSGVVTLDPATLSLTNSYDAGTEFDRAEPLAASDEFSLFVRTDVRSKFKAMRFSSPLRVGILTELHRLRPVHPLSPSSTSAGAPTSGPPSDSRSLRWVLSSLRRLVIHAGA